MKPHRNPYFNKKRKEAWHLGYNGESLSLVYNDTKLISIFNEGRLAGELDRRLIPDGMYCYQYKINDLGQQIYYKCPYWSHKAWSKRNKVGSCSFLNTDDDKLSKLGYTGLLFDQCKECSVKNDIEEPDLD